jgi:phage shock protein E
MKDLIYKLNATIVDVRTPEEFAQGHFDGAVNIPLDKVPERLQEFKNMSAPIVAYCRSGNRSGQAMAFLKQNGVNEVYNGGGLDDMLQAAK